MSEVEVQIYDSTLRDGAQAEGISFSVEDKLMIAERLDQLGVHYIEGGWPNSTNPTDLLFFIRARERTFLNAKITAFGSTRRKGASPEEDETLNTLLAAETEAIALFGKSWGPHVTRVLRTTLGENLGMIEGSVAFLKRRGREVIYDAEHYFDGYRADPEYAIRTLHAAEEGGADILILCDTNGGCMPSEVHRIIRETKREISLPFGVHMHNDAGMAVVNTIIGVELGAVQVQGTINGYGERCGNANLCTVLPNLELKLGVGTLGRDKLRELMEVSRFVSEVANVAHDHRQPYIGESAFTHKGGAHQDAVEKWPGSFEHISPEAVGNERRFPASSQTGRALILSLFEKLGYTGLTKESPPVKNVLAGIKGGEADGSAFEAATATITLMILEEMGDLKRPFKVIEHSEISKGSDGNGLVSEAIVELVVGEGGEVKHEIAKGNGPINAFDLALRKALLPLFPRLKEIRLEDYKLRVVRPTHNSDAVVRVLIEWFDGKDTWGTVGVSENQNEAGWLALVDSFVYKIWKDQQFISSA